MPMTAHVDAAIDNSMLGPLGGASVGLRLKSGERSLALPSYSDRPATSTRLTNLHRTRELTLALQVHYQAVPHPASAPERP